MSPELPLAMTLGAFTFLLTAIWGDPFVEVLLRLRVGKQIRETGPQSHMVKTGTPTMGGILILVPVILITLGLNMARLVQRRTDRVEHSAAAVRPAQLRHPGRSGRHRRDSRRPRARRRHPGAHQVRRAGDPGGAGRRARWPSSTAVFRTSTACIFPYTQLHSNPRLAVDSDRGVHHRGDEQRGQLSRMGWTGWPALITASAFVAYGVIAHLQGQTFLVQFCFIVVGRVLRLSVVQRAPGPDVHGRRRLAGARRGAGHAWH